MRGGDGQAGSAGGAAAGLRAADTTQWSMAVRTPDPDPDFDPSRFALPAAGPAWLSEVELEQARARLPILYVEAVPVRTDGLGQVTEVGVLLRANSVGEITRTLVSGRVLYGETLREALFRHLEKDLGPMAFPQVPASPVPFSVAEYFPLPGVSPYLDDRQHAVALAYVVPVTGTCEPRQDALELTWMTPAEAASNATHGELEGGRGTLLRAALASVGVLP